MKARPFASHKYKACRRESQADAREQRVYDQNRNDVTYG